MIGFSEVSMERQIPQHVAIILDGNGRWAKAKGLPRNAGHVKGAQVVEDMLTIVDEIGMFGVTTDGIKLYRICIFHGELVQTTG